MLKVDSSHRFIVFGCRPSDDLLVELHTNEFTDAVVMQSVYSGEDFKARIFDNEEQRFIKPAVIDHAAQFLLN